jgi:phosphoribosyl-ATP pyrophosphohydrolase
LHATLRKADSNFAPLINRYYSGIPKTVATRDANQYRNRVARLPDLDSQKLAKKLKEEGVSEFLKYNTQKVEKLIEAQRSRNDEEEF